MEAGAFAFEFDHASFFVAEVEEDFGEEVLEVFLGDDACGVEAVEPGVGDVEGGSELVGRRVGGVAVDPAEAFDGVWGAKQAGDAYAVAFGSSGFEGVPEPAADVGEESGGFRDEEGHGVGEGVDGVEVVALDFDDGAARMVCVMDSGHGGDSDSFGECVLIFVGVVENVAEAADVVNVDTARA